MRLLCVLWFVFALVKTATALSCVDDVWISAGTCQEVCVTEDKGLKIGTHIYVTSTVNDDITVKVSRMGEDVLVKKVPVTESDDYLFSAIKLCAGKEKVKARYDIEYESKSTLRNLVDSPYMILIVVGVGLVALCIVLGIVSVAIVCCCRVSSHSDGYKSSLVAYILWFFFGLLGVHRFYLNKPGTGIIYLLTIGLFGLGWILDLCLIPSMVEEENKRVERSINVHNVHTYEINDHNEAPYYESGYAYASSEYTKLQE